MSAGMLTVTDVEALVAVLREPSGFLGNGEYWCQVDPEFYSWTLWWSLWDEVAAAIRCVRPLVLLVEAEVAVREGPP